ncbi:hypothetical protein AB6A40_009504 [Gnathostoma spinigerum]|uniref:Boule n=1 Tax=Gnathostoma spinigerum TaxID=75299 RepID=A0ABD6ETD8_9BILA
MQEGAEIQDSPHDGSLNSSSISSPPSAAQEKTSQPASQVPFVMSRFPPGSVPPNHHILVDPTTGQHYLVPTAQPQTQPQIIYQPMYYSPTPAQPLYYPAFAGGQGSFVGSNLEHVNKLKP